MKLKWPKSYDNLKKITRLQVPKLSVFIGQKLIFRHYCIQNVKDRIQIREHKITNKIVAIFSRFISVKFKKNLRKSQAQFWEKFRK